MAGIDGFGECGELCVTEFAEVAAPVDDRGRRRAAGVEQRS